MALVFLGIKADDRKSSGYIINTKNIESFMESKTGDIFKFRVYLMNGENYDFNQIFYQGNFIFVHNMEQLYSLLKKLDNGENKSEGET